MKKKRRHKLCNYMFSSGQLLKPPTKKTTPTSSKLWLLLVAESGDQLNASYFLNYSTQYCWAFSALPLKHKYPCKIWKLRICTSKSLILSCALLNSKTYLFALYQSITVNWPLIFCCRNCYAIKETHYLRFLFSFFKSLVF